MIKMREIKLIGNSVYLYLVKNMLFSRNNDSLSDLLTNYEQIDAFQHGFSSTIASPKNCIGYGEF